MSKETERGYEQGAWSMEWGAESEEPRAECGGRKRLCIKNRALRVLLSEGSVLPIARTAIVSPENKEGLVQHHNPSAKKVISFSFWLSSWPFSWLP